MDHVAMPSGVPQQVQLGCVRRRDDVTRSTHADWSVMRKLKRSRQVALTALGRVVSGGETCGKGGREGMEREGERMREERVRGEIKEEIREDTEGVFTSSLHLHSITIYFSPPPTHLLFSPSVPPLFLFLPWLF